MGKKEDDSLDRDQQILNRLARIEHKVDSLEQTTAFALRADAERHFNSVKEVFGNSQRRAQVYLAANGKRSVQELADHLAMQYQNVSKELQKLAEEGLLKILETDGASNIWGKTPLDRTLRITRFLCSEYDLTHDGTPSVKKNTKPDELA